MVGTISPLVEGRKATRLRGFIAWVGHVVSAGIGGACLGWVTAIFLGGVLVRYIPVAEHRYLMAGVLTGLYMFRELGVLPLPVLDLKIGVPASWRARFGWEAASWMYGFALGWGFTARTPYSNFHIMLLWLAVSADPALGLLAGGIYGVVRALPPLLFSLANKANSEELTEVLRSKPRVHRLNGWTNGAVAAMYFMGLLLSNGQ